MSQELATRESFQPRESTRLTRDEIRFIAGTEFVPVGLRNNIPALFAAIATGRELGLGDMAAIRGIHVIDGRPTLSAEMMVALVRRAGHSIVGKIEPSVARVTGTRTDNGDTITVEWTADMAERAGLTDKKNWRKYEESMLWARAVSQLCRMLFADVFSGGTYTPEEIGALEEEVHGTAEQVEREAYGDPDEQDLPVALRGEPAHDGMISGNQRGRLWTIATHFGVPEDALRDIVEAHTGQRHTTPIPVGVYDQIVKDVEAWKPPPLEEPEQVALVDMVPDEHKASTRRKLETGED